MVKNNYDWGREILVVSGIKDPNHPLLLLIPSTGIVLEDCNILCLFLESQILDVFPNSLTSQVHGIRERGKNVPASEAYNLNMYYVSSTINESEAVSKIIYFYDGVHFAIIYLCEGLSKSWIEEIGNAISEQKLKSEAAKRATKV